MDRLVPARKILGLLILLLTIPQLTLAVGDWDLIDQLFYHSKVVVPPGQKKVSVHYTIYLVWGGSLDLSERLVGNRVVDLIRTTNFDITPEDSTVQITLEKPTIVEMDDGEASLAALEKSSGIIVLIGGPEHNNITRAYGKREILTNVTTKLNGQFTIAEGELPSGSQVISYSHNFAGDGAAREAVKYSPLKGLIPPEYIPLAASGLGSLFIIIITIIKTVIELRVQELGKGRHKDKPIIVRGVEVNEYLAIFGASFILGLSVTWVYFGPKQGFLWALIVNTAVSIIAAISHELSHRLVGRALGIRVKYKFWWGGSVVTLISGYLGNAFGIQGFLKEYDTEGVSKRRLGIMKVVAPITSIAIAAAAAMMYLKDPSMILRTTFVTASLCAMTEILPLKSLDGNDIRRWNLPIWGASFAIIAAVFMFINFFM